MDKKQLLEMGLTEEQADGVMKALDGAYVPKERFNEVNKALGDARKDIKTRDDTITALTNERDTLKTTSDSNTETAKELETLRGQLTAKDADILAVRKSAAERIALLAAKARNTRAAAALLDTKDLEYDPDADIVKGLDDRIAALKASDAYLFETEPAPASEAPTPKPPTLSGMTPVEGAGSNISDADPFVAAFNKAFK